ncbi:MAG: SHOCT domain-containing protein [Sulfurospirillum sp.]
MMAEGYYGMGGGFMWLFPLIGLGIFLYVVYMIFNRTNINNNFGTKSESALEVLKKRYARGEISKEEFEDMKKSLA